MGKRKYLTQIEELFEISPLVSFDSIQRITGKSYAKLLINNLLKKRKILRLTKGNYTKHNEISLAVYAFKPAYLGLQSALSALNLWEQETIPIILTTNKVRNGIRIINGSNILIKTIDKKYYFGYELIQEGDFYLPYSDLEKTFIDLIYFKQPISKETLKQIRCKINRKKLKKYLKCYPKEFQENFKL